MVFDINKEETEKLIEHLRNSRKNIETHLNSIPKKAKHLSGYLNVAAKSEDPFINGSYQRDGYSVIKYALDGEGDYPIPVLLFVPHNQVNKHPAVIYLHPKGKITEAKPGGEIEKLVRKGYMVAAVDVLGVGETRNTAVRNLTVGYTGVLVGKSIVGVQAGDIVRVVNYLKSRHDVDTDKIGAVAFDEMCLPLIHASAFETFINNIILIRSLVSYRSVAMNRFYRTGLTRNEGGGKHHPYEVDFSWGVAGVLTAYDLPDLIGCIAPRKVLMVEVKDQMLNRAPDDLIKLEMEFPRAAYAFNNSSSNLKVVSDYEQLVSLLEWCFN
jgi:hypothetical protein